MNNNTNIIFKVTAVSLMLIGLIAMIVAWELLLVAEVYTTTVIVLEMGGVIVCLVGYFLWRRAKAPRTNADLGDESRIEKISYK